MNINLNEIAQKVLADSKANVVDCSDLNKNDQYAYMILYGLCIDSEIHDLNLLVMKNKNFLGVQSDLNIKIHKLKAASVNFNEQKGK